MRKLRSGIANIWLLLLAVVVLLVGAWLVYDVFIKSDETRIRQLLQSAADGARRRSPADVSGILSDDFRGFTKEGGSFGGINKDLVHQAMIQVLMTGGYKKVEVTYSPEPIPVVVDASRKTASATFNLTVQGKYDDNSPWGEIRKPFDGPLKATFKKTDKGWRMDTIEQADAAEKPR
jgi:hypothetical protein